MKNFFQPTKIKVLGLVIIYTLHFGLYIWSDQSGNANVQKITESLFAWPVSLIENTHIFDFLGNEGAFSVPSLRGVAIAILTFAIVAFSYYLISCIIFYLISKIKTRKTAP